MSTEFDPMAVRGGKMAAAGDTSLDHLEDRARKRAAEGMQDAVTLSAQALKDGLISEEAHASTIAMADAVAEKNQRSVTNVAAADLREFIERIEALEEQKAEVGGDIKSVYGEAKGRGWDTKTIRAIVKIRKKDLSVWHEEQSILDTYLSSLGMI